MKKLLVTICGCLVWVINPAVMISGCGVPVPGFDNDCPPPNYLEFQPGQVMRGLSSVPRNQVIQLEDFSFVEVEFKHDGLSRGLPSMRNVSWIQSAHALSCDDEPIFPPDEIITASISMYTWTQEQGRGEVIFSANSLQASYDVRDNITFMYGQSNSGSGELEHLRYWGDDFFIGEMELTTDGGKKIMFRTHFFNVDANGDPL